MKVFFSLAILLVCMQAALGFMPTAPLRTRQAIKMSATNNKMTEVFKAGKSALAGLTPLILASPVFATEGTGEVCLLFTSGKEAGLYFCVPLSSPSIECLPLLPSLHIITNQALGVDDPRILPLIASIGAAFAFLFSGWSNKQDNEEFFNGYNDSERKVCRNEKRERGKEGGMSGRAA